MTVGHGNFEEWVEETMWFSTETAQRFMKFAKECDKKSLLLEYQPRGENGHGERFEFTPKVYNVWNFAGRNPELGIEYPGNIPGEIAMNVLYYCHKELFLPYFFEGYYYRNLTKIKKRRKSILGKG